MEWTPNESQHTKLTLEKKILPPLLPEFELATFRSRVQRSNQQAITAHTVMHKRTSIGEDTEDRPLSKTPKAVLC